MSGGRPGFGGGPLLDALVTPGGHAPETLTPRPRGCRPGVRDELSLLAAAPPDHGAQVQLWQKNFQSQQWWQVTGA
ncbi:hypothetical protein [Streptomyces sp. NRRL WC-3742]|uniref:hypothetical protein n=1 Tax=Streptomyces sp. NRRL WC-3742 TaxID=1463934 RepID=UPI0004C69366|nr:hypothetical protein [Streptomyces sp. NRRL WC-3742]